MIIHKLLRSLDGPETTEVYELEEGEVVLSKQNVQILADVLSHQYMPPEAMAVVRTLLHLSNSENIRRGLEASGN